MQETGDSCRDAAHIAQRSAGDFAFGNPQAVSCLNKNKHAHQRKRIEAGGNQIRFGGENNFWREDLPLKEAQQFSLNLWRLNHVRQQQERDEFFPWPPCEAIR